MHKCSRLPNFVEDSRECTGDIDSGKYNSTDCINWNKYYTQCKPGEMNPFSGAISFDNIGLAWVAIFLVSSTIIKPERGVEIHFKPYMFFFEQ